MLQQLSDTAVDSCNGDSKRVSSLLSLRRNMFAPFAQQIVQLRICWSSVKSQSYDLWLEQLGSPGHRVVGEFAEWRRLTPWPESGFAC